MLLNRSMAKGKSGRRKLTPEEQAEATRLSAIYERRKAEWRGFTQEKLASMMGFNTQGAVSQYLRGTIPMNAATVLRFAHVLKVDASEIRPRIYEQITMPKLSESMLDDSIMEFALEVQELPEADRQIFLDLLDRLRVTRGASPKR